MLVYRFEAEDGGGPWFYLNGDIRNPLPEERLYLENQEGYLYGCTSMEELYQYFSTQKINTNNCDIKIYNITKEEVIYISPQQIKFPKKYAGVE